MLYAGPGAVQSLLTLRLFKSLNGRVSNADAGAVMLLLQGCTQGLETLAVTFNGVAMHLISLCGQAATMIQPSWAGNVIHLQHRDRGHDGDR